MLRIFSLFGVGGHLLTGWVWHYRPFDRCAIGVCMSRLAFKSRCHGYGGTSMRYMRMDSSTGHRCRATHRTLLDASARLTPEEFGRFCQRVALDSPKKGRTRLKQGQLPGLEALALWEKPRPLAMRDGDALQGVDGSDGIVMVEEPCDWNIKLHSTKYWGPGESAWIIWHFRNEGHSVLGSVRQVIGLEHTISDEGQNKGTYPNLRDFKELS
ncbi:unnamed protein product [Sphagnum balticum]